MTAGRDLLDGGADLLLVALLPFICAALVASFLAAESWLTGKPTAWTTCECVEVER